MTLTRQGARDTIDKVWVQKVRKTWKGFVQRAKSIGYMEAEVYLQNGIDWLKALATDMAFSKGFFTFLREKKKQTDIYKMKVKAMDDLKQAWVYLNAGKNANAFWDNTLTPGTPEWKRGGNHRHSAMRSLAKEEGYPEVVSFEEADKFAQEHPRLVEKFLSKQVKSQTLEAVGKADAFFSRKFLAHLTRIMAKWDSDIEWGSFEREFSVGDVKVVMVDLPHPFVQEQGSKRLPSVVGGYINQLQKAQALLKQKGLGYLWYGTMLVSCKACGGENPLGKSFGVGAHYVIARDEVRIYSDPHNQLYRLVAHELGHRYYYKFMSKADRARFDTYFSDVPAVSEYGGTVSEEDFAEVFSYYIDNRNLTRDQLERFKQFLKTKGRMASDVAKRYQARTVARRFYARQFTPESWAKYKRKHPGAEEKDHDIVKPEKVQTKDEAGGAKLPAAKTLRQKLDRVLQSVSGVSKSVVQALREAPEKVQKFVVDKSYRDEVTKAAAKSARQAPEKIKKAVLESGKSELKAIFKDTPKILASLLKERRAPTKDEAKTLYGVGVYVAGTVLAMSGTGLAGPALAGAKAFGHSLGLHIGIKAMNQLADEGFLAYEAAESAATAGGIADALPVNTGDLPGLNQIWDALGKVFTGAEKKAEPTLDGMVERLIEIVTEELDQGLSDDDIVEMLKGEQP